MRKIILIFFATALTVLGWIVYEFTTIDEKILTVKTTPTPTAEAPGMPPTVTTDAGTYAYAYSMADVGSISLLPNFEKKSAAASLAETNRCLKYISGGFYDTAGKPLGFFYTDNKTYAPRIQSSLVNGFLWADAGGISISSSLPDSTYRFAMQVGPRLLQSGNVLPLRIQNDEHARRMVVATASDGKPIFLAVYNADSVYEGPLLAQLPEVVATISREKQLSIADAVNLDGGSASAFSNGEIRLSELTPVGSLLCVK